MGSLLFYFIFLCHMMTLMQLCLSARMGSQVMVPYRGLDEEWRHLKLMGDLGQVLIRLFLDFIELS